MEQERNRLGEEGLPDFEVPGEGDRLAALEAEVGRLRAEVRDRDKRIQAIQEIGRALSSSLSLDEMLGVIMDNITFLMDADRSTLFLVDEDTRELWSKVLQGPRVSEIRLKFGEGIAGWVAQTGKSINIKDAYRDQRFNRNIDIVTGYHTRSCLCQPIRNLDRRIIGVIQVLNKRQGHFTVEDENLLSAIASQTAVSIENSKLYLSVVAKNIELLEYKEKLEQKMYEVDMLYEIESEAAHALDIDAYVKEISQKILSLSEAQACIVTVRAEGKAPSMHGVARAPKGRTLYTQFTVEPLTGSALTVVETGRPLMSNAPRRTRKLVHLGHERLSLEPRSIVAIPLVADGRIIGAIELINKITIEEVGKPPLFNDDDLKILTLIGSHAQSAIATHLYRAEHEQQERLSAIGQMVSTVLHDLKTPVTIISGYVQMMVGQDDRTRREDFAEAILKQFDTLSRMTKEILAFSRGESTILLRKVYFNKFMEEAAQLLQNELGDRDIELILENRYYDIARFDEVKLKRVFANLARNAADAMPHGGTLTVTTERVDDTLVFTFADTGFGVPPEIQHRLFESFVTLGKPDGTGLGLAIVRKIIDEHNGTITFESQPDHGTTFVIRLPVDDGEPA